MSTTEAEKRVLGCLLGGAVGDALGAPIEFMTLDEITTLVGPRGVTGYWQKGSTLGAFTDDTQMTLFTAEGLILGLERTGRVPADRSYLIETTARSYDRWWLTQQPDRRFDDPGSVPSEVSDGWLISVPELWQRRAPGSTCLSALQSGEHGSVGHPLNDSKGCGGVMRVAPVGLTPGYANSFEFGCDLAAITHGHPSGYLAAGALAHIIGRLNARRDLKSAVVSVLLRLREEDDADEVISAIEQSVRLAREGDPSAAKVETLGRGWVAEEALSIALYCSLVAKDFRSGVLLAVNHSGDSDSTGSITGQILGLIHGVDAIPVDWLENLELRDVVTRVSEELVDAFYSHSMLRLSPVRLPDVLRTDAPPSLDRFRGLMLGTVVGDCLGRPVEGSRHVPASYLDEIMESPPRLYSDDSVMTLALSESLLECNGFSPDDMAQRFAAYWHAEPHRGYGGSVVQVFRRVLNGVDWFEAAQRQFGGEGSYGNGGAMRVAPVALWTFPDLDEAMKLARRTAMVTHTHPVGVEGAEIQTIAALHALRAPTDGDFNVDALLDALDGVIQTQEFRSKFEILHTCLERDDDERARLHLGNWVAAHNSVITALYCFLLSTSFEDAILRAIRMAGDTDTIAAMTGALAGARYGFDGIPEQWRDVEDNERILTVADSLHRLRIAGRPWPF